MVALADFCKDRRREIERKESAKIRQDTENGYSRSEMLSKDIVLGTKGIRNTREEAMQSFEAFLKFFPYLPDRYPRKYFGEHGEATMKPCKRFTVIRFPLKKSQRKISGCIYATTILLRVKKMKKYEILAVITIAAIVFYTVCYYVLYWYIDKYIYEN